SATLSGRVRVRDTVAIDTPASSATRLMVAMLDPQLSGAAVKQHEQQQHAAEDELAPPEVELQRGQHALQQGQRDGPEHGAEIIARAAGERNAADHHGDHRGQYVLVADRDEAVAGIADDENA